MRAAPSVEIQAALRGGWWLAACGAWLLAATTLLAWSAWHCLVTGASALSGQLPWLLTILLAGLGLLSSAAAAIWHARRHPAKLRWDGQVWHCSVPGDLLDDAAPGQVELMLDVGNAMLLRWHRAPGQELGARTLWLPVARSLQPAAWHGLRVALHRGRQEWAA